MNPKLRKYLESIGLKASATEAQAWAFMATLEGSEATEARRLAKSGEDCGDGEEDPEDEGDASAEAEDGDAEAESDDAGDAEASDEGTEEEEDQAAHPTPAPRADRRGRTVETEAVAAARAAERSRINTITNLGQRFGMPAAWIQRHINAGTSVRAAKDAILEHQASTRAPLHIAVGEDLNRSSMTVAAVDALLVQAGFALAEENADGALVARQPHARSRALAGQSARNICRAFLRANGVPVAGLSDPQVVRLVFSPRPMGVHTTSDFDNVLANALNKSLQRQYQLKPVAWQKWCSRNTAPDFRQVERPRLAEAAALAVVREGGEYTLATVADSKEVYTLVKYGRAFELTWEALLADDLGAFGNRGRSMLNAARRLEDVTAFGVLTANANMGDGTALFVAGHGNIATGSDIDPPTVATLNVARKQMRVQTSGAQILNIEPRFLIAPAALEGTVMQLLASQANPASSNAGVANVWQNRLEPIIDGTLDSTSATGWYTAADPGLNETVEVCFLRGNEQPTLEVLDKMNPDKRTFTIRHVVAAKALDWKSLTYNAGT